MTTTPTTTETPRVDQDVESEDVTVQKEDLSLNEAPTSGSLLEAAPVVAPGGRTIPRLDDTVVADRRFKPSLDEPVPPAPEADKKPTWPWKLGLGFSALWLGVVGYSLYESGFPTLSGGSSLIPWELAAFSAAVALPVALVWLVVAYLDRGQRFECEVAELRGLMRQMAYPSGAYEARIKAISESLRAQAQELNDASHRAVQQTDGVRSALLRHTEDLNAVGTRIETDTAQAVEVFGHHVNQLRVAADGA
ncbi:MAG: hypothetical protein JXQ84_06705, partial [Rhodospirillaceae bacterium]|nr:hypothetical protein [Rhodospirillaceae bacterium]